jgi:hypothetical protein
MLVIGARGTVKVGDDLLVDGVVVILMRPAVPLEDETGSLCGNAVGAMANGGMETLSLFCGIGI